MKDRRQYEVIDSRQMEHLRVFHDVARALTSSLELEEILTIIMHKMAHFFGPERWSMLLVDEKAQDLYYAIAVGENAQSLKGLRVPLGEGVAGWVAKTGNPLVVPDVRLDPHWSAFAARHRDLNIQSICCVPVRSGEKTLGVIQLLNSQRDLLSEYSVSFVRMLCDYAAIAIRNSHSVTLIHELTITDDVTGLFNARHLYTTLEEQVALARDFSVLFVDLDHFKSVNDTHGHLIGSRLLAEVGSLLKRSLGPTNLAFRYGGDEFVAVMPGMNKKTSTIASLALREDLRATRFLTGAGLALAVSGSFGLASFPEDADSVAGILRAADTMMYEAKTTRDNLAIAGLGLQIDHAPIPAIPRTSRPSATALGASLGDVVQGQL